MIIIMFNELFEMLREDTDRPLTMAAGTHLFCREDPVRMFFLLDHGAVDLVRHHADGRELVLHRSQAPAILAEASLHTAHYHCDGICRTAATVSPIPKARVVKRLREDGAFRTGWAAYLSHELQAARYRAELLTRKTVAERLAGWLEWHDTLPPRGEWRTLAAEIGVTPEALYREMAKMRETD